MPKSILLLRFSFFILAFSIAQLQGQAAKTSSSADLLSSAQRAVHLAESGHCKEALPLLKKALPQTPDKDLKRTLGLDGVRCAMGSNQLNAAQDFLKVLNREFPGDPEVLYTSVHTYSDLATQASQQLAIQAPNSPQAHELNAESFEMQGKWEEAAKEYEAIARQNPKMPGLHFRLGRLLLSEPSPPADAAQKAKKEFQQELEIDPNNAGAEYVLGEMARQDSQWDEAIQHFSKATQLDSGFGDAYLGLGSAFLSAKRFSEAIPPLQAAVKLEPRNPGAHYNLATALTRAGRKEEAEKEFAIHRQMTQKGNAGQGAQQQNPN
jgi:tetratricopeptide (TPR) repeat protein